MSKLLVSAIMPTFNEADQIADAICSIQAQSMLAWELIVVDDGSTDATARIIERMRLKDDRIQVITFPQNKGRGAARNAAVSVAQGKYLVFCDADDTSTPNRFQVLYDYLEAHPEVDLVSSQMLYFSEIKPPHKEYVYPSSQEGILKQFEKGKTPVPFPASMIRASIFARFGTFREVLLRAQDREFLLRIYPHSTFHVLPDFLYHYRHDPTSVTLGWWMRNERYSHYAVYLSRYSLDAKVQTFDEYTRRWGILCRLYTYDLLRYVRFRLKAAVSARRRREHGSS